MTEPPGAPIAPNPLPPSGQRARPARARWHWPGAGHRPRPTAGGLLGQPGAVGGLVGLAAGLVVLAPTLGRGYLLSYDMVFVPRPPITSTVLGTDGSVPRAVPSDLFVDLLARLAPAWVVQQAVLMLIFVLAGWGIGRLVPHRSGAAAAAVAYSWNAYVAERLVLGHWAFLLGYAVLPWVAGAAMAARRGAAGLPPVLLWLGAAAVAGSTSGLIATATAVTILTAPPAAGARRRLVRLAGVAGYAAVLNAPWWLPALARPGGVPADPAGVTAFAARADSPLGALGSLVTLGGSWNPAVWPTERGSVVLVAAALLGTVAAVALGLRAVLAAAGSGGPGLVLAAAGALLVAAAGTLPLPRDALRAVVLHVPGGGVLRDGQKFLAPTALLVALGAGQAVGRLLASRRTGPYGVLLGVLPLLVLPTLAWGVGGRLAAVHYPASWTALRAAVRSTPAAGDVTVLPWGAYRRFGWNGGRVLLDPMPRLLPRRVVTDDALPLSTVTVGGEDPRAARIAAGLAAAAPLPELLRGQGIRLVVVYRDQPGGAAAATALSGLPVRYRSEDLLLVELPGPLAAPAGARPWLAAGLVAAGVGLAAAAAGAATRPRRGRRDATTGW